MTFLRHLASVIEMVEHHRHEHHVHRHVGERQRFSTTANILDAPAGFSLRLRKHFLRRVDRNHIRSEMVRDRRGIATGATTEVEYLAGRFPSKRG